MKILILKDKNVKDIGSMMSYIKESYRDVTEVEWEPIEIDASGIPWEYYSARDKGISKSYITKMCKEIWKEKGYEIDHVIWMISRDNWGAPGIGGWNLGRLYSNYSVQIVLAEQSGKWAGLTLGMEIIHAMDELAPIEIGIDLNKIVKMDWDNDVVHGEHPSWGVKRPDGSYFTDYDYSKVISTFGTIIKNIYSSRRVKELQQRISLLQRIVELMRKIRFLKKRLAGATPAPLEGGHYEHNH